MIVWLSRRLTLAVHDEQLARFGGRSGIRDEPSLNHVLTPTLAAKQGDADLPEIASVYAIRFARCQPFAHHNLRTAFIMMETFLELNGLRFVAADAAVADAMWNLAGGFWPDQYFREWVQANAALS